MERYACVTLRQRPEWMEQAAAWFHDKWGVPKQAYLQCMKAYLHGDTEYGWYLCAVYTEEEYRGRGIAGRLLTMAVEDLKSKGITPVYLLTEHTGFYERYGWQFLCMVQGNGETGLSRMYIHR